MNLVFHIFEGDSEMRSKFSSLDIDLLDGVSNSDEGIPILARSSR